tara:strand:+ start:3848 stop:4102 length:255 start_codon:yes stop_codon:yes gene_type:complete
MAIEKRVTHSRKNKDGDITHIKAGGSIISKELAIIYIDAGLYGYYTYEDNSRADVYVYNKNGARHIKTNADRTSKNNLDNLPDC